MDDLQRLDLDLRSINLDAPRSQTLSLDKMFTRAHAWAVRHRPPTSHVLRPSSPPRTAAIYPLPQPLIAGTEVSPLAALFDYPELIPHVLNEFEHPREMAVLCRVSKTFERLVRKRMYRHIWVRPWEEGCHSKLVLLFDSLSKHPELCKLIKRLDVRFFPLAAQGGERYDLDEQVRIAISNMVNLEHLVWTRDKSLNPAMVEELSRLPNVRSIELSGHSDHYYNPSLLGQMAHLDDLRFMMPDQKLRNRLVSILRELDGRPQGGLKSLGLICRNSPLIDDDILKASSPYLKNLRRLALWGCSRVTKAGLIHILQEAENLEDLSIDALPHSEMLDMGKAPEMPNLCTYSLSIAAPHRVPLYLTVEDLPRLPPVRILDSLHITLSAARASLPLGGIEHLIAQTDFEQLRKLSLLNLVLTSGQLAAIIEAGPDLEELYVSTNGKQTLIDCPALDQLAVRVFHVTAPEKWAPMPEDLAQLARRMKHVEQIGSGNRVYEVLRKEGGDVDLVRWGRTVVPGYFQIWRG